MNSVNNSDFFTLMPRPIILYGAGLGGRAAYAYLERRGVDGQVIAFVDGDPKKQGSRLFEKPVTSLEGIRERPEALIVITSALFNEIDAALVNAGITNPRYCYFNFSPAYGSDEFWNDEARLREFYESDDPYTAALIGMMTKCRTDPAYSHIREVGEVSGMYMPRGYWEDDIPLPSGDLTVVDGGAFTGDTIARLMPRYGGQIRKYYAFEPDGRALQVLRQQHGSEVARGLVECREMGLGDVDTEMFLSADENAPSEYGAVSEHGDVKIRVGRLDGANLEICGRLCIKMDIESFELKALEGAIGLIRRHRPHLAICVYHKMNDVFEIPEFLRRIVPEYSLRLRGGVHMTCYAVPNS